MYPVISIPLYTEGPKQSQHSYRIDSEGVIKVADFSLTEDMYGTNYFRRGENVDGSEEKVPIKWMAPESIERSIYNEKTDVVSVYVKLAHNHHPFSV